MDFLKHLFGSILYDRKRARYWFSTWSQRRACYHSSALYRKVYWKALKSYLFDPDERLIWRVFQVVLSLAASTYLFWYYLTLLFSNRLIGRLGWVGLVFRILVMLACWAFAHLGLQDLETPISAAHQKAYEAVKTARAKRAKRAQSDNAAPPPAPQPPTDQST